jgi:ComF family protein
MIKYLKGLLNLFLNSNCALCQRPTSEEFCLYCSRQLQNCHISDPTFLWENSLPAFVWGNYSGSLKQAIKLMKYENHPEIARPLGQWLGEVWLSHSPDSHKNCIVVPLPLNPIKEKQRGYDQAALIAKSFCETTGLRLKLKGLQRVRETQALFGLSPSERKNTLVNAFAIGKDFYHRPDVPVLLIDDIYTTGATARSAAQTLNNSGIVVSSVAAVATTNKCPTIPN